MTFPEKIKAMRKHKNMSQAQFAEEVGASMRTIQNWETGRNSPSKQLLYKIADIFDVDYHALISDRIDFVVSCSFVEQEQMEEQENERQPTV